MTLTGVIIPVIVSDGIVNVRFSVLALFPASSNASTYNMCSPVSNVVVIWY